MPQVHIGSEKASLKPDTTEQKTFKNLIDHGSAGRLAATPVERGNEQAAEVFSTGSDPLGRLVASRLNHRYRSEIDPDAVMQSAMGSFFDAARHSRIQVSHSVSLWRLLATFARRKMARKIERYSAAKRGGKTETNFTRRN